MQQTKTQTTTRTRRPVTKAGPCFFDQSKTEPNYKDVLVLKRYTSDRGKVLPQKYTGLCSKHQRQLANEVKKARYMGLLPYTDRHAL